MVAYHHMRFSRIAITARTDLPDRGDVLERIVKVVEKTGAKVFIDAKRCDVPSLRTRDRYETSTDADLVIVVGGDGTIISTIREMENPAIPILGIHSGTLGFLTSLDIGELDRELPGLLTGTGIPDRRQLLNISIEENGKRTVIGRVLNEVVVSQGGIARLLRLRVTIDRQELTVFRADGLIVATPTGSTAYSLAAGGSIVCPNASENVTILTPINPHRFSQKPIIVPGTSHVAVEVLTEHNAHYTINPILTLDGQVTHPLKRDQTVCVAADETRAHFLRKKDDTFYERIRKKLHWGG